jgi:hypothetical protein
MEGRGSDETLPSAGAGNKLEWWGKANGLSGAIPYLIGQLRNKHDLMQLTSMTRYPDPPVWSLVIRWRSLTTPRVSNCRSDDLDVRPGTGIEIVPPTCGLPFERRILARKPAS